MKSTLLSFLLIMSLFCPAQKEAETSKGVSGKNYVFNYDVQLNECDAVGTKTDSKQIIPQGSSFKITHLATDGYVITVNIYTLPSDPSSEFYKQQSEKRDKLNFKNSNLKALMSEDNRLHFFLPNSEFSASVAEVASSGEWNFGTLVQPFKLRGHPTNWTSDISLGAVVGWQGSRLFGRNLPKDWSIGFYGGLSLSKINLDSLSTNGKVKVTSERPALTPSFNIVIGYKSAFSITAGIGWDHINVTSDIERSWVYQDNRWFGIGIGIKLFTANKGTPTEKQDQASTDAKAKKKDEGLTDAKAAMKE